MAKGKDNSSAPRPPRNSGRPRRQPSRPSEPKKDRSRSREQTENPEWWRGDPDKSGEVL